MTELIKGTTPTHVFKVPLESAQIQNVEITYSQSDEEAFRKGVSDCVIEDYKISVQLKQEDTLKLNHKKKVQIQIRVRTVNGEVMSSRVIQREVEQCLSGEVLE